MIKIESKVNGYGINFPTELKEVNKEFLDTVTANIKFPKYYCIVALCFKTKIFDLASLAKNPKETSLAVSPILAKIHEEDIETVHANVGDKIVVDRSSLERGSHIRVNTVITSTNVSKFFNKDNGLVKSIITGGGINKQLSISNSPEVIVIEFKIIGVNDIRASVPVGSKIVDPCIIKLD